jgi:uncharacterized protein (TIGR02246 family)
MRKTISGGNLLIMLAAVAACAFGARAQQAGAAGADEAAVRENVRRMEEGWNKKSGELFASPFAADADYVVINGSQIKGRETIARAHQGIFDTVFKDSALSLSVRQIRFLRPEVALAHVAAHLRVGQGAAAREADATITMVMTKDAGGWKIGAFQNTGVETGGGTH